LIKCQLFVVNVIVDLITFQATAAAGNVVDGNHGNRDEQQDKDIDEAQSDDSKCMHE